MSVNHSARPRHIIGISFRYFKCKGNVFQLELPYRGDSNKYTQYTIFNIKKKTTLNYPKSAAMGFCAKGLKKEFQKAVVNEPSVFEPLKVYCNC